MVQHWVGQCEICGKSKTVNRLDHDEIAVTKGKISTHHELRDLLVTHLREQLMSDNYIIEAEGKLAYHLPSTKELTHAFDILVSDPTTGRQISIELKYQQAVTDQFKCRAYDTIHMKKQYGDSALTVMLFVQASSGISI